MPIEVVVNAFAAGELSPNVYGRTDLQQYQQGAAELTNMVVLPAGSARKRPGTKYLFTVDSAKISTFGRLCKFTLSDEEDALILITSNRLQIRKVDNTSLLDAVLSGPTTAQIARRIRRVQTKSAWVFVSRTFRPSILEWDGANFAVTLPNVGYPVNDPTFANSTNNHPGAVTIIDERVVLGGSNAQVSAIWGSAIKALDSYLDGLYWTKVEATITGSGYTAFKVPRGEFYPTDYVLSPGASDSKDLNFYANSQGSTDAAPWNFLILDNAFIDISWITSTNTIQNGFLIVGTRTGLYAVIGSASGGSISAASPINSVRQLSSSGCSDVQGIIVNNFLVYVDNSRRRLRVATFNFQTDQYDTPRLTDLATHLFDSDVVEIHYQKAPYSILWVLLDNGKVLAFNYDATGTLAAWTPMEFGGNVTCKSIEVLSSSTEDIPIFLLYDGDTKDYRVERLMPFEETNQDEFWFVDSGVRKYNATAFTVVDGLNHLEGREVAVWADGAGHPPVTVASGKVTLNRAVNTAIVGVPYKAQVTTLPVQFDQEKRKRVSKVFVRFLDTIGARAGDEFEEIVPFMQGNFQMGAKPAPFTGIKEIPYFGRHEAEAQVSVFSETPTPFHVLSVTTRLEIYG